MNLGSSCSYDRPFSFLFPKAPLILFGALTGACCWSEGSWAGEGEGFGKVLPLFLQYSVNTEKAHLTHNWQHLFTPAHYISLYCLILNSVAEGPFITGENIDTSSDLMLAQMLQMEFDREYDAQLRREEKKFNGDSKGTMTLL